jgi:hypothetical protein
MQQITTYATKYGKIIKKSAYHKVLTQKAWAGVKLT